MSRFPNFSRLRIPERGGKGGWLPGDIPPFPPPPQEDKNSSQVSVHFHVEPAEPCQHSSAPPVSWGPAEGVISPFYSFVKCDGRRLDLRDPSWDLLEAGDPPPRGGALRLRTGGSPSGRCSGLPAMCTDACGRDQVWLLPCHHSYPESPGDGFYVDTRGHKPQFCSCPCSSQATALE